MERCSAPPGSPAKQQGAWVGAAAVGVGLRCLQAWRRRLPPSHLDSALLTRLTPTHSVSPRLTLSHPDSLHLTPSHTVSPRLGTVLPHLTPSLSRTSHPNSPRLTPSWLAPPPLSDLPSVCSSATNRELATTLRWDWSL